MPSSSRTTTSGCGGALALKILESHQNFQCFCDARTFIEPVISKRGNRLSRWLYLTISRAWVSWICWKGCKHHELSKSKSQSSLPSYPYNSNIISHETTYYRPSGYNTWLAGKFPLFIDDFTIEGIILEEFPWSSHYDDTGGYLYIYIIIYTHHIIPIVCHHMVIYPHQKIHDY